jgi:hypothetical protein
VILPDWEGKVTGAFAMEKRVNDIGIVFITNRWTIFDNYTGPDPLAAVMQIVTAGINEASNPALNSNASQ